MNATGPAPRRPALAVRGLGKRFGARPALADVSFALRPGEVLGLIGPNGAGKTTLFACLAGLLAADAGEVRDADDAPIPPAARRRHLFFVPDGIAPWPAQRVREVVATFVALWGAGPARGREVLADLELASLAGALVGTLSKGERKRLLVALALLAPQPVLLLDEPFDGLDLRQTRRLAAILRAAVGPERTLFLSIHQLADAERVCDRFVLLADGRVAGEGSLATLREATGLPAAPLEEIFLALT